jgi:hypothetical protein
VRYTCADLRVLAALSALLRRADPVPPNVRADAEAAGLRLTRREPRLRVHTWDLAWLLPT